MLTAALIITSIAVLASGNYDMDFYCNNQDKLCEDLPTPHVGCGTDEFSVSCGDVRSTVPMTRDRIEMILDEHNSRRNKIALGQLSNFGSASRMATISWDFDLASLALINVKKCRKHHSGCRNTPEYKYAGQNIAISKCYGDGSEFKDNDELIKFFLKDWYDEYLLADESMMKSTPTGGPIVYHFLTMACDRQTHVGCAMSRYIDEEGKKMQYFTCNYATTSMADYPVYVEGSPASSCKTGENPKYPGLCSENEKINPNNYHCRPASRERFERKLRIARGEEEPIKQEIISE